MAEAVVLFYVDTENIKVYNYKKAILERRNAINQKKGNNK